MIPVKRELCEDFNLDEDTTYNRLLKGQFIDIDNNKKLIKEKAVKLLELNRTKPSHYELRNCCDYKKLVEVCNSWKG